MITISLASKDEIQNLQNLNDEVFLNNHKYDSDLKMDWAQSETGKKYFTDTLNNPDSICIIAKDRNRAVGYIEATPKEFGYRLSKYIEINNMGVTPDCRSKGVGSMLMKKLFELAKAKGFQKAYVNTYSDNVKAVAFYEKNGFAKIDVSLEKTI